MDLMGEVQLGLLPINMEDLTGAQILRRVGKGWPSKDPGLQERRFQFLRFQKLLVGIS